MVYSGASVSLASRTITGSKTTTVVPFSAIFAMGAKLPDLEPMQPSMYLTPLSPVAAEI